MSDLTIDFEWIDPLEEKSGECVSTWARLSIFVDTYPLTRVLDQRSKTLRDGIYLPLYPLAEWLVNDGGLFGPNRVSQARRTGLAMMPAIFGACSGRIRSPPVK